MSLLPAPRLQGEASWTVTTLPLAYGNATAIGVNDHCATTRPPCNNVTRLGSLETRTV